jgi:hypothetical protein
VGATPSTELIPVFSPKDWPKAALEINNAAPTIAIVFMSSHGELGIPTSEQFSIGAIPVDQNDPPAYVTGTGRRPPVKLPVDVDSVHAKDACECLLRQLSALNLSHLVHSRC